MAYAQKDHDGEDPWRARFKRPDGTYGSRSGFSSETAAENWGNEQEALIRRNMWIDPRDAETPFGDFAEEWMSAVTPRHSPGTTVKYRSHLDTHLLPQWRDWPVIGIFNSYVEIEKWVSELHEDLADSTVASVFATFSTIMNAVVRARMIPANPCYGIRVTGGAYEVEHLIATPVQGLRAAMRLHESLGLGGFVLCLADLFTGARWSELAGQQRHEYDRDRRAIGIRAPLQEVNGALLKAGRSIDHVQAQESPTAERAGRARGRQRGRTKTPAGTRMVDLPPTLATFYEMLLDSHSDVFVFTTPEGKPWRRSNFRQRFWRPAWDGVAPERPWAENHRPAILPWFTFHEGRHTHSTWLAEDGIPEVARRARLGQKMKGIARVYDHVTPEMRTKITTVLERRWQDALHGLTAAEQERLRTWFPHIEVAGHSPSG
ncbi:tyrosine-type recombinase/integrase [Actinokineospora iranica]|uniref:Phage integrase family protein n=1 Tax=Actinokineospora iranica TaxID=1271860 RepID=A0A1G6XU15_9PSEU|nr:tyrosine-type recombinase/integrase [Actinokineospora iranica]SDD80905.1 Phage integrase family protein [Actinokineospora iranica]